jgi:2-keto-3-deoxy-L-rhamnonate aldolase RhmA
VLGHAGLDFAVLDAEHAPFGIEAIDRALVGAAAVGLPLLVRVPRLDSPLIGASLDAGAAGVVVPHVGSASDAALVVAAVRFAAGQRGVSPSGRGGGYGGLAVSDFLRQQDAASVVCCQIEDRDGVDQVEAICQVDGVDCLLIGRVDLMVSLGAAATDDPMVEAAVRGVAGVARQQGVALAIFVPTPAEIDRFRAMGFTAFLCGSDQSLLRHAAAGIKAALKDRMSPTH